MNTSKFAKFAKLKTHKVSVIWYSLSLSSPLDFNDIIAILIVESLNGMPTGFSLPNLKFLYHTVR